MDGSPCLLSLTYSSFANDGFWRNNSGITPCRHGAHLSVVDTLFQGDEALLDYNLGYWLVHIDGSVAYSDDLC